jgi:hypothetical protein
MSSAIPDPLWALREASQLFAIPIAQLQQLVEDGDVKLTEGKFRHSTLTAWCRGRELARAHRARADARRKNPPPPRS